uniref:MerR-DNA-bind domain-containing protein n=1 Tax=Angiostrongylus cantonensis TaxID=6313 RepID=A0A0K0DGX9_ANGCA
MASGDFAFLRAVMLRVGLKTVASTNRLPRIQTQRQARQTIYIRKTNEDLCKAIQIIEELERRIGRSTGELAAFKKSLDEIRCDLAATQTTVHEKQ